MEAMSALNDTAFTISGNMTLNSDNGTELWAQDSATGASIASPIVMFLAGLIGNVLALVVLRKTKREIRNMMFYTLVAALTWNDLLGICLTSPPVLAAYLSAGRQMPALPTLCRFHAVAMVCFGLSTPFIVCAMAVERSLALNARYFYSRHCTPAFARLLLAVLWAAVLVFGALPLFDLGSYSLQYPKTWCFLDFRPTSLVDKAYAYSYAFLNLAVVAVMVLCNVLVMTTLCRVRKTRRMSNASVNSTLLNVTGGEVLVVEDKARSYPQQQILQQHQQQQQQQQHQQQQQQQQQYTRRRQHRDVELQMIWLLCTITTIFAVCWVPLMAYIIFCLQSPTNSSPLFGLVAVRLASLNQTINPWIYVILRKSLLSRVRRLCRECLMCYQDQKQKPLYQPTRVPVQAGRPATRRRPNNYVHVRHQLCPSSQFVGQQNEGHSGGSKDSGSSRRNRSRSQGGTSVCSVCRARMKMERAEGAGAKSVVSLTPSSPRSLGGSRDNSLLDTRVCSGGCGGSAELTPHHHHPLTTEDNQTLCLPRPSSSSSPCPQPSSPPPSQHSAPAQYQVSDGSVGAETCRRSPGARGRARSLAHIPSYLSEADDHGYSSKVSTDSSRMSTPERPQPTRAGDGDGDGNVQDPDRPALPLSEGEGIGRGRGGRVGGGGGKGGGEEERAGGAGEEERHTVIPMPSISGGEAPACPHAAKQNSVVGHQEIRGETNAGLTCEEFESWDLAYNGGSSSAELDDMLTNDADTLTDGRRLEGRGISRALSSSSATGAGIESPCSLTRSTLVQRHLSSSSSGH